MSIKIFVKLPVRDLNKSMAFFRALGWDFNKQFTDDTAASLVISEHIYAMLLTHKKYAEFTNRQIADTSKTSQVMIALSVDGKEEVNRIADAAMKAGASR